MFIFFVTAKSKKEQPDFKAGDNIPFIVYIDFKDMFGVEKLCQIFLFKEGFFDIHIEKRKLIPNDKLDSQLLKNDKALAEVLETRYMIQMFDTH